MTRLDVTDNAWGSHPSVCPPAGGGLMIHPDGPPDPRLVGHIEVHRG